ncbi:hypothetical protein PTKIN_Ptkin15bG0150000 [Pterospermum kingtungense]
MMQKVSIIDDDEGDDVLMREEWVQDGRSLKKQSLLGKLLFRKPYSLEAMRTTFIKVWQISNDLDIKEVGERLFLFQFGSWIEKAKVLTRQP